MVFWYTACLCHVHILFVPKVCAFTIKRPDTSFPGYVRRHLITVLFLFGISPQVESIDGSNATKYSPNYCYVWYAKWFLNIRSTKAPHRFGFEHQGTAEIRDFLVYIHTSSKPHSFLWSYRHISRKPPIMMKNHTMRSKMTLLLETFVPCTWPLHQNQNGPYNIRFIVVTVSQQMPLQIWRLMNW